MKFYYVATKNAAGTILAHSTYLDGQRISKGSLLNNQIIQQLMSVGCQRIMVAQLEKGDIEENVAAKILANEFVNTSIVASTPFAGRVNLISERADVLTIVESDVHAFNAIDESITLATLTPFTVVDKGEVVGTIKIIPFSVPNFHIREIQERCLNNVIFDVKPVNKQKIALIQTKLKDTKNKLLQKSIRVTEERLIKFDREINLQLECEHSPDALAERIEYAVRSKCDLVMIIGACAIMDRRDVIPRAIELADGYIDHLGTPTEPGNLMLIGRIKNCSILGLPGCARSPKQNGLDLILPRMMAGLVVDRKSISRLGVGGLLKTRNDKLNTDSRTTNKAIKQVKVAAVILAAGSSLRMQGHNKLLENLGEKPLLHHVLDAVTNSRAQQYVLVTGHEADQVRQSVAQYNLDIVDNPDHALGIASSIKTGLAYLRKEYDAVLIILGDMPDISSTTIDTLISNFNPTLGAKICVPTFKSKRGNPVLWSNEFFSELSEIQGDVGGKQIIGQFEKYVYECELESSAIHDDIDTPSQLALRREKE